MIYVFYHDDLDGIASANCLFKYYYNKNKNEAFKIIFTEINNSDKQFYNAEKYNDKDKVYYLDCSDEPEEMKKVNKATNCNLYWIDHHKSAIEKWNAYDILLIKGFRILDYSAAKLTYMFLYNVESIDVPGVYNLISDYDTWNWKKNNDLRPVFFNYGVQYYNLIVNSTDNIINKINLSAKLFEEVIKIGEKIYKYERYNFLKFIEKNEYDVSFNGYNCVAINTDNFFSEDYEDCCDILIAWHFNGKNYIVELRSFSEDVDVSKIALKYGGGGHLNAGGFTCDKLPF
jgi:hypothetical protein